MNNRDRRRGRRQVQKAFTAMATAGLLALSSPARGASGTWTNLAGGAWSLTTNWSGGIVADGAGDTGNFSTLNILSSPRTITIDTTSRTLGTLLIGDNNTTDSQSYLINATGGGTLTFDNVASNAVLTQIANSNGDTISAPIILNSSLDITNNDTSTLTLSTGGITAGTAGTKTITILGTTTGAVTMSGVIAAGSGNVAIVKGNASNALTLSAANTFGGGVTLNAGTLNLNNSGAGGTTSALGTGALTVTGGTIASTAGSAVTLSTNNAQNWNGDFSFGGTQSLNLGTGAVTMNANRSLTIAGSATYTVGGIIGDGGGGFSLTTANATAGVATGILGLSGSSTYTGGTNINGGVVRFNSGAAIPATGAITIQSGGALSVSGAHTTLATWLSDPKLSTASTGALSLAGASSSEAFTPGAFSTLSLGSNVGNSATYTGLYTPAGSTYFVGGGGGTITFSNVNAFTGARSVTAGNGGGGTVILSADNDYSGATTINAGTLQVGTGGTAGSLGATTGVNITNGTLAFNRSDTVAFNVPISGAGGVTQMGTGILALGSANTYAGTTAIRVGTLRVDVAGAIPTGSAVTLGAGAANGASSSAGALDMTNFSQNFGSLTSLSSNTANTNVVTIGSGRTLTITGNVTFGQQALGVTNNNTFTGGGTLSLTGTGSTLNLGLQTSTTANQTPVNNTLVNLAGLGSFTTDITNFNVGFAQESGAVLILSDTNNDIVATTLTVANSNSNNGADSSMQLGAGVNLLKVTTLNIGISKVAGTVKFASQADGSPGTVSITGKTGGATTANITLGSKGSTSTGAAFNAVLDLRGHISTVQAGTVVVGQDTSTGSTNTAAGTIFFNSGTFTVASLTLGNKTSSASAVATGTLNVGGGTFTINTAGTFRVANKSGSAGTANGVVNLTGGTLISNVDMTDGGQTNALSTFTLDGGTLNMTNHNIGSAAAPIDTLSILSGTLQNVLQINGGAGLTKTSAGTLTLAGVNAYTGGTVVNAGALLANSTSPNSSTGAGAVTVNATGTLGGTGNIGNTAGTVLVNSGGSVAPGASVGTLSLAGPLTFAAAGVNGPATLVSELNAGGTSDLLSLTGAGGNGLLTIGAGSTLNLVPLQNITGPTTYTIASFASETGQFTNVLVNNGPTQSLDTALPNYALVDYTTDLTKIQVTVANLTAVPEPATAGLLGLGAVGLLLRRRRRRA